MQIHIIQLLDYNVLRIGSHISGIGFVQEEPDPLWLSQFSRQMTEAKLTFELKTR
jgi:hypothetical protein